MAWWETALGFGMFFLAIAVCTYKAAVVGKKNRRRRGKDLYDLTDDESELLPERKMNSGKCDGDCKNCPPHYGYRYGRWYYGHDHSEGCEFGGNRCGGGMKD